MVTIDKNRAILDICLQYLEAHHRDEIGHFKSVFQGVYTSIDQSASCSGDALALDPSGLAFAPEHMGTVLVTLATTIVYNFVVGFIRTCARSIAEPKLDDALNGVEQKLLAKGFPEKLTRDLKTFSRNYILGLKE